MESDFSPLGLFLQSGWLVKGVMLILISLSILSWSIVIEKMRYFRQLDHFYKMYKGCWRKSLFADLYVRADKYKNDPYSILFKRVMDDWKSQKFSLKLTSLKKDELQYIYGQMMGRVLRIMEITINEQGRLCKNRLNVLATISSVSPFIGLFGTVWGIMNSFQGIALEQSVSLAVVAPGVAEALFATAIGLFSAIPALVMYNYFIVRFQKEVEKFEEVAHELEIFFHQTAIQEYSKVS